MGHGSLNKWKQQSSGGRHVRGRLVVLSDGTRLSWSAGPRTMLRRLLFGSGCTVWLQRVDAVPVAPKRARDQPLPTLIALFILQAHRNKVPAVHSRSVLHPGSEDAAEQ